MHLIGWWSLRYLLGWGKLLRCVVTLYVGEWSQREQCCLLGSQPAFTNSPPLPTSKLGPSGTDSQVGGFVYILGSCGSLQWTLLWGREFLLLLPQSPQFFTARDFEAFFSHAGTLGWAVCFTLQLFLLAYPHTNVGLPAVTSPTRSSCCHLAKHPLHPGYPSLALPGWMNVSGLTPWLLDFHIVWFSGSSGCFCFKICCCLSFGCARKQSVSTYTSI